jgi:hypothetical protein
MAVMASLLTVGWGAPERARRDGVPAATRARDKDSAGEAGEPAGGKPGAPVSQDKDRSQDNRWSGSVSWWSGVEWSSWAGTAALVAAMQRTSINTGAPTSRNECSCFLLSGNWQLATGNWQLATGNWQLATGNWQLLSGNWQLATGNWPLLQELARLQNGLFLRELLPSA